MAVGGPRATTSNPESTKRAPLRLDLVLVIAVSVVAAAVCGLAPPFPSPLRASLALLLTFVLPGYSLVAAAFPPAALSRVQRVMAVVAASLMSSILGGLALGQTEPGLTRGTWALLLAGIAAAGSAAALVRWRNRGHANVPPGTPRLGAGAILLVAAGAIIVGGVYMSVRSAEAQWRRQPPFTELSALRQQGGRGSGTRVKFIVESHERTDEGYHLTVYAGGDPIAAYGFRVRPGGTWTVSVSVPVADGNRTLVGYLERAGSSGVYRYVKLVPRV